MCLDNEMQWSLYRRLSVFRNRSKFAVNTLPCYRCLCCKSKSPHTFLKTCLYYMLVKFEQIRMVQTNTKFWACWQKKNQFFLFLFFDKDFDKNYGSLTLATRVKSCIKHGIFHMSFGGQFVRLRFLIHLKFYRPNSLSFYGKKTLILVCTSM